MTKPTKPPQVWTERAEELLKTHWPDPSTSSRDVADLVCRETGLKFTRNAIIGKAKRMGVVKAKLKSPPVCRRSTINHVKHPPRPKKIQSPQYPEPQYPELAKTAYIPEGKGVTLFGLTSTTCRWPIGEPHLPGFYFCGEYREPDTRSPYCPKHTRKAGRLYS